MSTDYHHLTITGPALFIRGIVAGHLLTQGMSLGDVYFDDDLPLESEGVLANVAERFFGHANTQILAPARLYGDLRVVLERAESLGIKITGDKLVHSASCDFWYKVYNPTLYREVDGIVRKHATGLRLSNDYLPDKTIDPEAKGIEAYSPAHEFTASAKGTMTGDLESVLLFRKEADTHPLIDVGKIKLHQTH